MAQQHRIHVLTEEEEDEAEAEDARRERNIWASRKHYLGLGSDPFPLRLAQRVFEPTGGEPLTEQDAMLLRSADMPQVMEGFPFVRNTRELSTMTEQAPADAFWEWFRGDWKGQYPLAGGMQEIEKKRWLEGSNYRSSVVSMGLDRSERSIDDLWSENAPNYFQTWMEESRHREQPYDEPFRYETGLDRYYLNRVDIQTNGLRQFRDGIRNREQQLIQEFELQTPRDEAAISRLKLRLTQAELEWEREDRRLVLAEEPVLQMMMHMGDWIEPHSMGTRVELEDMWEEVPPPPGDALWKFAASKLETGQMNPRVAWQLAGRMAGPEESEPEKPEMSDWEARVRWEARGPESPE